MNKRSFVFTFLLFSVSLFAQVKQPDFWNDRMLNLATEESFSDWVFIKPGLNPNPRTFFIDNAEAFSLTANDKMSIYREFTDDMGYTHYRFQQSFKGVKVESGEFIVHQNNQGKTYLANGKMVKGLSLNTTPAISVQSAINLAMDAVPAKQYYWEMPFWEDQIKEHTGNDNASYYPAPELVVARSHNSEDFSPGNFRLAYKVDIRAFDPWVEKTLFIDAATGEVFNELPLAHSCDAATFETNHYGNGTTYTQFSGGTYRLLNDCQTANIHVRDWNGAGQTSPPPPNPAEITSSNNTWNNTSTQEFGASTLLALGLTYEYFRDVHSRYGYNGSSGSLNVFINAVYTGTGGSAYTANATYNGNGVMTVGIGSPDFADSGLDCISSDPLEDALNTIDIMGHEFGHGVDGAEANLTYQGESGALDESFADIYGCMVEQNALNRNDWLMGAERCTGYIRNLANPNDKNHPDTYGGTHWKSTASGASDNGGVHSNSGVQNHWFYLLCQGGVGTNDNGTFYNVTSIGYADARQIAYYNHRDFLVSAATYADARFGSMQAAAVLYGWESNQMTQTIAAWQAVGVGDLVRTRNAISPVCTQQSVTYNGGKTNIYPVSMGAGTAYEFSNCNSTSADTKIAIYRIDAGSVLVKVAENDNFCGLQSKVNYTAQTTGKYLVYILSPTENAIGILYYQKVCPIQFTLTPEGSSMLGNEGSVSLIFDGGYANPATFLWSNGATTQSLSNVPTGTYCVTVTDANGVVAQPQCATVDVIPCYYTKQLSYVVTDADSAGVANGAIALTVNNHALNGPRTYSYQWSAGRSTKDVSGLAAGIYDVTVTDNFGCITTGRTYINQPHVNDGPLKLTLRVVQVFARDYNEVLGEADNTWLVSAKDVNDVDGTDFLSSVCIVKDVPYSAFIPGDGYRSPYSPVTIATMQFGVATPQFYRLKIDAWEDDCSPRCSFDPSCSLGFDQDDARCNEEININIPFRYQPVNTWNDDGWFYSCNTSTGSLYGVRIESKWEYTAIPANSTIDGPIRLQVRADYMKARDFNDVVGGAENIWKFNVYDLADLDGQSSKQTCFPYSISSSGFPYTTPAAVTVFDRVYASLVPEKYTFSMQAWEEDRGDECNYDGDDGNIFNDDDDARCIYNTPQYSFRVNPAGVWHLDATDNNLCGGAYGIQYSSRWSYLNGDSASNPIAMGAAGCDSTKFTSKNTTTVYTNTTGSPQASKDVYYRFELKEPADVVITTCNPATDYDTYLYLTDLTGTVVNSNDDLNYPDELCSRIAHSNLPAGKYNIIVEGYSTLEGLFDLSVDIAPRPAISIIDLPAEVCISGDTIALAGDPAGGIFSGSGVPRDVVFAEDFNNGMPATFTLIDADGLIPHSNVAYVNAAWVVNNNYAVSTSWYAPPGISDDWMITPQITLPDYPIITWKARAADPAFPDGYEVRISTASAVIADFMMNPPPFATTAESTTWTTHTVNLSAYAGQAVYLAFRNNSSDQFLLWLDDIEVSNNPSNIFVPANAGAGTHTITYSGINANGCLAYGTDSIIVNPLPDASFTGLPNDFCFALDTIALTPALAGGAFQGNGIIDSSFNFYTEFAAVGKNIITYHVTDSNGCSNSYADSIAIHQLPTVAFAITHVSQAGNDGSIELTVTGTPPFQYLWSNAETTKDIANLAAGTYFVTVTDSNGCITVDSAIVAPLVVISGTLLTGQGAPLAGAYVTVTGDYETKDTTNASGQYSVTVPQGGNYVVTPLKNNDNLQTNGITTLDISLIRRHILGTSLNTPYKIIAGDVNLSNSLSTLDISLIRKLILGSDTTFSGKLWAFVRSDSVSASPPNAFPAYRTRIYSNLSGSQAGQDFTGMKLGDVNDSWNPLTPKMGAVGEVQFAMDEYRVLPGNEIRIPVKVKDFSSIAGYQFTMTWDPAVITLLEVLDNSITGFYGKQSTGAGMLTTSWNEAAGGAKTLEDNAIAFELRFKVVGELGTVSKININSEFTQSEAYTDLLDLLDIVTISGKVQVGDAVDVSSVDPASSFEYNLQVRPNPFSNSTNIYFNIPLQQQVVILIYDMLGKEVKTFSGMYSAGGHQVAWNGDSNTGAVLSKGLYQVKMIAGNKTLGMKVLYLR